MILCGLGSRARLGVARAACSRLPNGLLCLAERRPLATLMSSPGKARNRPRMTTPPARRALPGPLPSPHSHGSGPSVSAALSASAEERWALRLHKAERALEVERRVSEELRQQLAAAQEAAARGRAALQRMEQVTGTGGCMCKAVGTGLERAGDDTREDKEGGAGACGRTGRESGWGCVGMALGWLGSDALGLPSGKLVGGGSLQHAPAPFHGAFLPQCALNPGPPHS